ncbi:hypothetical protein ANN_00872 [Periplaneta americana]|uniref:Uncharacterized protein n=1 Tax=Periplaneta americana TaxID=6978 RepID=A0ABQ8TRZ6_PERAM|nr:hypothetical protein ANN_00872 [Periplaneta americana]
MSPGSSNESYPAFAHIGLRENPRKTSTSVQFHLEVFPLSILMETHSIAEYCDMHLILGQSGNRPYVAEAFYRKDILHAVILIVICLSDWTDA